MGNFLGKLFGFEGAENEYLTKSIAEKLPPPKAYASSPETSQTSHIVADANIEKNNEDKDETVEKNIVKKTDKRTLVTKEIVEIALRNDYGKEACLLKFDVVDFTKPGDNYATLVTSIQCEVEVNGKNFKVSYVVKLNNQWQLEGSDKMTQEFFVREGKFLTEVKSRLNEELDEINEPNLLLPVCVYEKWEMGKEVLIMKDLRERGFKMFNRHIGMDVEHATMALNALARVHAAGFIFKEKNKEKTLLSIFPYMVDEWIYNPEAQKGLISYFRGIAENGALLLKDIPNYIIVHDWLMANKDVFLELFKEQLKWETETFTTICHGDIWNNNIVFRYNENEHPEEVILLDLQMSRVASLGTDLNYYFYGSLNGEDRIKHLDTLLGSYYTTLTGILEKAQIKIPFSYVELKQEFEDRYKYGLVASLMLIPIVLAKEEDVTDFTKLDNDNIEEMIIIEGEKNEKMMKNSPSFKSRLLMTFDEGLRLGIFN